MARWSKPVLLAVAVIGLVIAGTQLPIDRSALELIETIRGLGALGWLVFVGVYVAVTITLVPASVLTLGAGFAYGLGGALLVWPAAMIGSAAAFAIGRWLARDYVAARLASAARLGAIDEVIGTSGFKITALLRLSPLVPFGLLNYGLGVTRIRTGDYLGATAVGIVPGMFMYIYFGSSVGNLAALADGSATDSTATRVAFWVGLAVTVGVTVWVTRLARRRVAEVLESRASVPQDVERTGEQETGEGGEAGEVADVAHLKTQGERRDGAGDEHGGDLE